MINQSMRNTFVAVLMTMLATLGAGLAYGHDSDDSEKVRMKFAGALLLNVEQQQVDGNGVPLVMTEFIGMSRAKARGSLGRADVNVVTKSHAVAPEFDPVCPDGFLKVAEITENAIVFTFSDLSLLYGDGQGVVCLNFTDFITQFVSIDGTWTGGAKRFKNAEGEFSIVIDEISGIGSNTQFSAETGRITGFLNQP